MSWADQVAGAEASRRLPYVEPGVYVVDLDAVKEITSRNNETMFIIEQVVVQTNNPARPVGMKMADIFNFKHEPTPGAVKTFLMAALGIEEDALTGALAKGSVAESNPLHGIRMKLQANNVKTKADNDFTKTRYERIATAEEVAVNPTVGLKTDDDIPF